MHAFDYVIMLLSFVYAAAITHVITVVGDLILASRRVSFSWFNAGWMLVSLLAVISWWITAWDMRVNSTWSMSMIWINFGMACLLYLIVRLVSPRVPESGELDLRAYHLEDGRKYLIATTIACMLSVAMNIYMGQTFGIAQVLEQNAAVLPMTLAAAAAAIWIRDARVQTVALAVELAVWVWYYASLQGALTG